VSNPNQSSEKAGSPLKYLTAYSHRKASERKQRNQRAVRGGALEKSAGQVKELTVERGDDLSLASEPHQPAGEEGGRNKGSA